MYNPSAQRLLTDPAAVRSADVWEMELPQNLPVSAPLPEYQEIRARKFAS